MFSAEFFTSLVDEVNGTKPDLAAAWKILDHRVFGEFP